MRKIYFLFLTLFLCLFCSINLQAAKIQAPRSNDTPAGQTAQSGFDIVKSTLDQIFGSIAPAAEDYAKKQIKLAEAKKLLFKAKGWQGVAKFFGGGLDCLNSLKNGWDIGTAINGCISAFQKKNYPEFTKKFNEFAKATVKTVAAIATTALLTAAGTAGTPVLALVGGGLAIGVATDYLVSKINLKKPLDWVKRTWNSFRKKDTVPLLISVKPGSWNGGTRSSGGGQKTSPSPAVKMKKHQVY